MKLLASSAIAISAWSLAVVPADAQQQDSVIDSQSENGIIVTGVRASLRSAADLKRNAPLIVDAITSEDIGKFPTENVADASQRITGVQITRTRGSGTAVSIRGLPTDFTRVQLNGSTLSSAIVDLRGGGAGGSIGRSFDFRLLPTEFVSAVEVTKSQTADMQEGGLAGTINVKTVRPLDVGKTMAVGSVFGVWNSNSGKITPQASGLFSTTLADGRLGILVAGGYSRTKTETHSIGSVGWGVTSEATFGHDLNGDGLLNGRVNLPSQIRTEIAREDRQRTVLTSAIEFQATDSLKFYTEGFYSRFDVLVDSLENLNIFTGATGGVFNPADTRLSTIEGVDPSQLAYGVPYATSIGLSNVDVRANDRVNDSIAKTYYGKVGADFKNDAISANISFAYSKSSQTGDNLNLAQIQRFQVAGNCEPGQTLCGLSLSPESQARYLDPQQGIVASLNGAFGRKTLDRVNELKGDLRHEFDTSWLRRISIGGVASWRRTYSDATALIVPAAALAPLAGLSRSTINPAGFGLGRFTQIVSASRGDFLGAYNGNQPFPTQWLATDTRALLDVVPRDQLASAGVIQDNPSSIVDVRENILAGYVQADFASADDRLSGNIGIRAVRTKSASSGVVPDMSGLVVQVDTGGTITVPPAGALSAKNSYTRFLPSANLRFQATDELILRAGFSRTLSRPSLTQISPSTTVAGGGGNYNITAGNPELRPFISTNYDLTAEWYPNRDTSVTLAVFVKDLSTLVRSDTDSILLPITFYTAATNSYVTRDQLFQRTRPTNAKGVTLEGFELGYQQMFTSLPGLLRNTGVQANYTYISNSDPDVLTAASKNNFNVSAFYEDSLLALRASYTWRDKFVTMGLPGGYGGLGVTTQARGNLDINVTVNVNEQVSLVLQGTNILDNVDKSRTTLGDLPVDYYDTGHQYMVGARVRF
ncbi:MAG: TonB-dependent receptor [Sphingobium sp.]|nr:TonB-dependent receptor [Sphingobium sp.]